MKLKAISLDIKLAHSIFALPFACAGLFIAHVSWPSFVQILLLLACMFCARSFAMAMNRIIDHGIDSKNPRTQNRALPSSQVGRQEYLVWALLAGIFFILAAFGLNPTAGWLSVPLLVVLLGYSFMKRWSWLTHWYLGACLGLAPIAAVIALNGEVNPSVILLSLAVMFWTAGFDIIYSLQDEAFDRQQSLHSVPAKFGTRNSLRISQFCFISMIIYLLAIGWLQSRGWIYYTGVFAIAGFLGFEHHLIAGGTNGKSESKINAAFFTMNAYVSVFYLIFLQLDLLWTR